MQVATVQELYLTAGVAFLRTEKEPDHLEKYHVLVSAYDIIILSTQREKGIHFLKHRIYSIIETVVICCSKFMKMQHDADDRKKQSRPFLSQFFSPILLKAFSITFFGEWGDKSQLATIGLAADENPLGVVLGGILGQALCTTAAVLGGKSLATQISEKVVSS
ncbi:UNVERIFIED_CONTAM: GDT1-like protein 5 [Sesamum indicum]